MKQNVSMVVLTSRETKLACSKPRLELKLATSLLEERLASANAEVALTTARFATVTINEADEVAISALWTTTPIDEEAES